MFTVTLNQFANSNIWFDPATIWAEDDNGSYLLEWDSKRNCFIDVYTQRAFEWDTIYNAPIIWIDSKQGYGNTLFVIVKLS